MPELPEVELARATIERAALRRRIADVDDADTYECRPHGPGEIRDALLGRSLTGAFRRGKTMWCETSGTGRSRTPGPVLGLHLGMSGRIVVSDPQGANTEGGDWLGGRYGSAAEQEGRNPAWDRFTITFVDGGSLRLFDKRPLGRVWFDPDLAALGPDAEQIGVAEFRDRVGRGTTAIKARLLDQSVLAGVGNLLADETLWQGGVDPRRRVDEIDPDELTDLHRALRRATKTAIRKGGVHTGEVIGHRRAGAHCPRCGAEMQRGTVGGRTTWWCPVEQT
ncbi:formamidopyrimidine-DNA glycosylase [soil metagenome]